MRNLHDPEIDRYRLRDPEAIAWFGWEGDRGNGAFLVPSCIDRAAMVVVVSDGDGWDHASISRKSRVPNWAEMEQVKRLLFGDELVMQLHVAAENHINQHPNVLHLWRPNDGREIPAPPSILVGTRDTVEDRAAELALRKRMGG